MGSVRYSVSSPVVDYPVLILIIICAASSSSGIPESTSSPRSLQQLTARFISRTGVLVTWQAAPTPKEDTEPRVIVVIGHNDTCDRNNATERVVAESREEVRLWGVEDASLVCVRLEEGQTEWTSLNLHYQVHEPAQLTGLLPESELFAPGDVVRMPCPATGHPTPSVRWYFGSTILVNDDQYTINEEGDLRVRTDLEPVEGPYFCRASNAFGSAQSNTMRLERAVLHPFPADEQMRRHRIAIGDGMELECRAPHSVPSPVISWQRLDTELDMSPRPVLLDDRVTMGASDGSLLFVWTEEDDAGLYQCHVVNSYLDSGTSGSLANLTFHGLKSRRFPPRRLYMAPQSASTVVLVGQPATLQCVFNAKPAPATRWKHKDRSIASDTRIQLLSSGQQLHITKVRAEDEGGYSCEALNAEGHSQQTTFHLVVNAAPKFVERPRSVNITRGQSVHLACRATGTPAPHITWHINGRPLTESVLASSPWLSVTPDATRLTLHNTSTEHSAALLCTAANLHGVVRAPFYVNVFEPTRITRPPTDIILGDQDVVVFPCAAQTDPGSDLTTLWMRGLNTNPITVERHRVYIDHDFSLVLNLTKEEDGGKSFIATYTCWASNGISSVKASARLRPVADLDNVVAGPRSILSISTLPAGALYVVIGIGVLSVVVTLATIVCYVRKRKEMRSRLGTDASLMSQFSTVPSQSEQAAAVDSVLENFPSMVRDPALRACVQDVYIERHRIQIASLIGKGQFGRVYSAILIDPRGKLREKVAVKTLKYKAEETDMVELFLREAMMMRDFRHLHVLSLIGIALDGDASPMVVLPFMANGDLRNYILDPRMSITVLELLRLGLQVARGMVYLSSMRFVHRDLAARNCMVDGDGLVRVADFGLSRELFRQDYYRLDNGKTPLPIRWMAPESLDQSVFTTTSDMWSMGVLLWELMTRGAVPYPDVDNWDIPNYIKTHRRLARPVYCPASVYDIMVRTWAENPQDRPSFSELVSDLEGVVRGAASTTRDTGPGPTASCTHLYANMVAPASSVTTDYRQTTV